MQRTSFANESGCSSKSPVINVSESPVGAVVSSVSPVIDIIPSIKFPRSSSVTSKSIASVSPPETGIIPSIILPQTSSVTGVSSVSPEIGVIPCVKLLQSDSTERVRRRSHAGQKSSLGTRECSGRRSIKRASSPCEETDNVNKKQRLCNKVNQDATSPVKLIKNVTLIPISQLTSSQASRSSKANDESAKNELNNKSHERTVSAVRRALGVQHKLQCDVEKTRQHDSLANKRQSGERSVDHMSGSRETSVGKQGQLTDNKRVVFYSPQSLKSEVKNESVNKENNINLKCLDSLVLETRVKKRLGVSEMTNDSPVPFCLSSDDDCESDSSVDDVRNAYIHQSSELQQIQLHRLPAAWDKQTEREDKAHREKLQNVNGINRKNNFDTTQDLNVDRPATHVRQKSADSQKTGSSTESQRSRKVLNTISLTSLHRRYLLHF